MTRSSAHHPGWSARSHCATCPMIPDDLLSLARSLIAAPNAGERHWREAARLTHRAVHHLVAAHPRLDPPTFAAPRRADRATPATIDPGHAPAFIPEARASITTTT